MYYQDEERRQAEERAKAPRQCPHCDTPINVGVLSRWDRIRYHCGATACRSAAYRQRKVDQLEAERKEAKARVQEYAAHLPPEQAAAVREMCGILMSSDKQQGHKVALAIIDTIESQRCKHDKIAILLDNASAAKRRATEAERYNSELQELYKQRIAMLQRELSTYQLLEGALYKLGQEQLAKQPDFQERAITTTAESEEPDEDRQRVLATLERAGIQPYTGQTDDDSEDDEQDESEEEDGED